MDFFSFTPQESKAIIFLVVVLLIGSGVTLYKKYHPDFAPEILLGREWSKEKEIPESKQSVYIHADTSSIVSDRKINLNTATLEELETLPGIGIELGKRILAFREERGSFSSTEELQIVKGIGPKTYDRLKNLVSIE